MIFNEVSIDEILHGMYFAEEFSGRNSCFYKGAKSTSTGQHNTVETERFVAASRSNHNKTQTSLTSGRMSIH